jgi:SAM-dependent methyltransferase
MSALKQDYFDELYGASDDPYALRSRWYEERKRAVLLAALPLRRYRNAYEPGCGVGELTGALAQRCDQVLASDMSERAVEIARERTRGLPQVAVARHVLPGEWPVERGPFDLIVVSEMGYFLDGGDMQALARCCERSLDVDGTLVACDWRPDFEERVIATSEVHGAFAALGLSRLVRHEEDDFLLQVWSRDGRSVARREGIR